MAIIATRINPDNTLEIILDPAFNKQVGVNIEMAVITVKGTLSVVVSANSLYQVFSPEMDGPDWFEWHVAQSDIIHSEDWLVSPEGYGFFTTSGSRKVAIKENNGKTADLLAWLEQMEEHIAPQVMEVTSRVLLEANTGIIH